MIGAFRFAIFGLILLIIFYFLVSIYSRSVQRETLEKRFDAGGVEGDRDAYIAQGMAVYEKSLRKRLIWLVFVIPMVFVGVTVYLVNYQ